MSLEAGYEVLGGIVGAVGRLVASSRAPGVQYGTYSTCGIAGQGYAVQDD